MLIGPYWWPTIHADVCFACDVNYHACKQQYGNEEMGVSCVILMLAAELMNPNDWRLPSVGYLENGRLNGETTMIQRKQNAIRN